MQALSANPVANPSPTDITANTYTAIVFNPPTCTGGAACTVEFKTFAAFLQSATAVSAV